VPFDGHYIVGNLRFPKGVERPPLALLIPGTESVKEEFPRWEEEFLIRGLATLSMDGPGKERLASSVGSDPITTCQSARCWTQSRAETIST